MSSSAKHLKFMCKFSFIPAALGADWSPSWMWLFAGWQGKRYAEILQQLSSLFYNLSDKLYQSTGVNPSAWNYVTVGITSTSGAFLAIHRYTCLNFSTHGLALTAAGEHQWELMACISDCSCRGHMESACWFSYANNWLMHIYFVRL